MAARWWAPSAPWRHHGALKARRGRLRARLWIATRSQSGSCSFVLGAAHAIRLHLCHVVKATRAARLHFLPGEGSGVVAQLVKIKAVRVRAGQPSKKSIAVFRRAKRRLDDVVVHPKAVDGFDRRLGVLLASERNVCAASWGPARVSPSYRAGAIRPADGDLENLAVLAKELLRAQGFLLGDARREAHQIYKVALHNAHLC
mmetsp:Transcript_14427/g.36544  ORF Transcript_14427/g.36544 Transcript_14427/m.36544 type:complete len:201 (-) Transcript_14427:478-1080(-)